MAKITAPFVRSPYNYNTDEASNETAIHCEDPSLAQQQFAEESDINFIADRYGLTGEMPQVLDLPKYGDFTGVFDFQTAQQAVINAKQQFMTLPAKMRERFDNDPQKLLHFMSNEDNRAEAEFLGLVQRKQEIVNEPRREEGTGAERKEQTRAAGAESTEKAAKRTDTKGPKTDGGD